MLKERMPLELAAHVKAEYHGSYPDQAERIACRLVAAWNAAVGVPTEELEKRATELAK